MTERNTDLLLVIHKVSKLLTKAVLFSSQTLMGEKVRVFSEPSPLV